MEDMSYFFTKDDYPSTQSEAERAAFDNNYDTIVVITDGIVFLGRSKAGIWSVGIPFEINRIKLLIDYENKNNRKLIFWTSSFGVYEELKKIVYNTENLNNKVYVSESESFLCHSTTLDNFIDILEDGELRSYNELKKSGRLIETIRDTLKESEDYFDYVDLCSWKSMSSEVVVASKIIGTIPDDINFNYVPGVRIYFDFKSLRNIEGFTSDGVHIGMVSLKCTNKYKK